MLEAEVPITGGRKHNDCSTFVCWADNQVRILELPERCRELRWEVWAYWGGRQFPAVAPETVCKVHEAWWGFVDVRGPEGRCIKTQ